MECLICDESSIFDDLMNGVYKATDGLFDFLERLPLSIDWLCQVTEPVVKATVMYPHVEVEELSEDADKWEMIEFI